MASAAKQQNYRRLMREAKVKSSSQSKKIDHPLARSVETRREKISACASNVCVWCVDRYNALDQLNCVVCGQTIKSELLWSTHLKSRRHKEVYIVKSFHRRTNPSSYMYKDTPELRTRVSIQDTFSHPKYHSSTSEIRTPH